MEKLYYPGSIVIIGLSSRSDNLSRMILDNMLRWGYRGKIFGVNPKSSDMYVGGIKMYKDVEELPQVPDLAVCLIPARYVPEQVERCGAFGIGWMAIPSGGFSEFSEDGRRLSERTLEQARKQGIRLVGPNCLAVANRANGLCIPFVPLYPPLLGDISIITQSGGLGFTIWNQLMNENLGMAKFASVGNKLDLDEVDFLRYFGSDPETNIILMYLENVKRGKELVEAAAAIDKPVIVLKSNTTAAGAQAAMSHTAALTNDENTIDAAFEEAGIIRIRQFNDFTALSKAFKLPAMKGNRIMVMSPAGGFAVTTADLCAQAGFEFAHPGDDFYQSLQHYSKAGVIKFSNPLDMGDIYDPMFSAHIFFSVMHNDQVDGALYVSPWPYMPSGDDVFSRLLHADLSKETWGAILSSGKPMGICLLGISETIGQIKRQVNFPVFNSPEEMVLAMSIQRDFYQKKAAGSPAAVRPSGINRSAAEAWINAHHGITGEAALELLSLYGIPVAQSLVARQETEAVDQAEQLGYPVVMKVVSPDALHKSEAKGVMVNIQNREEVRRSFRQIKENLAAFKPDARFAGVLVQQMAPEGYDMFVGGACDDSFGPVVSFGFGGVYVEAFKDVRRALCPVQPAKTETQVSKLKSYAILTGSRGKAPADRGAYLDCIVRVSYLLADFPQIKELDINPLRVLAAGSGTIALDARVRIG